MLSWLDGWLVLRWVGVGTWESGVSAVWCAARPGWWSWMLSSLLTRSSPIRLAMRSLRSMDIGLEKTDGFPGKERKSRPDLPSFLVSGK
jgi:hypothetical protein